MKLIQKYFKDVTSKDWLNLWLSVTIILTILHTTGALFLGCLWGLAYTGFLIGLMVRISYMKTELFVPIEMLISIVFWTIWDIIILLFFMVQEVIISAYPPHPEAKPMILLYLGYIMCPILAGLLRQRLK